MSTAKSPITTHVLDTSKGRPAEGVPVVLSRESEDSKGWEVVGQGSTDADGRITDLLAPGSLRPATYRIRFATSSYFARVGVKEFFYPWAEIVFQVNDAGAHYHVPLLLNPFGYSTYRGS